MPPESAPPPPPEIIRARVVVRGRVQGVGFRMYVEFEASRRGLKGWVRNSGDHELECVFEGPRPEVEATLAWCHQGPPHARVGGVRTEWLPPTGEDADFRIRHSV